MANRILERTESQTLTQPTDSQFSVLGRVARVLSQASVLHVEAKAAIDRYQQQLAQQQASQEGLEDPVVTLQALCHS